MLCSGFKEMAFACEYKGKWMQHIDTHTHEYSGGTNMQHSNTISKQTSNNGRGISNVIAFSSTTGRPLHLATRFALARCVKCFAAFSVSI